MHDTFFNSVASLNDSQKEAVMHNHGSLLVIAGAGSGKTRVITTKIAYLMQEMFVDASSILALTFTNKAAREMQERIVRLVPGKLTPFVGTFHSYCLLLLKRNLGYQFTIMDQDDQEQLIKGILEKHHLLKQITPRAAAFEISQAKNKLHHSSLNAELFLKNPLLFDVYKQYEHEKKVSFMFDFDDLLLETLNLFLTKPSFKAQFQSNMRYILVDEYQDTNKVQHALLKEMALNNNTLAVEGICVVGDEDQSIYSWRGATIANMLTFTQDFGPTQTIKIAQNYRSVQPILQIANHLIENNRQRNHKSLWSERDGKNRVILLQCASEYQESESVAQLINSAARQRPEFSCAVLYRTHTQSRTIEESLIKHNIAYRIIGGIQFYERKEIKDLLSYLKLITNPFDRVSFLRVLNTPARGLGDKCQETIMDFWNQQPFLNCITLCATIAQDRTLLPPSKAIAFAQFISIFDGLSANTPPKEALQTLLERSGYLAYLKRTYDDADAQTRIENVKEFMAAITHFQQEGCTTTAQFLEEIALMQDKLAHNQATSERVVTLMTMHAAKGLEFDIVIIAGVEESIIPSPRSLQEDNIEEERRLFYVAITRAREYILFSYAKNRYVFGSLQQHTLSRFIHEIPTELIPAYDCAYWDRLKLTQFLTTWISGKAITEPALSLAPKKGSINTKPNPLTSALNAVNKAIEKLESAGTFTLNQKVTHPTYGAGIIKEIDKKGIKTIYLTIDFASGTKKIASEFVS